MSRRLAAMQQPAAAALIRIDGNDALVEFAAPCRHYRAEQGCLIFDDPERPQLCAEFPDNLFNRDDDGTLRLDDDHAEAMIVAYRDYCPAVAALR